MASTVVNCDAPLASDTSSATTNAPTNPATTTPKLLKCVFSDLDGTLCHFERHTQQHGVSTKLVEGSSAIVCNKEGDERRCRLLPSSTMGCGAVSDRTVELVGELRRKGVRFVIISGARSTTVQERMPLLPFVDAVACETGSKILYPPKNAQDPPEASEWILDHEWAKSFSEVTGPLDTQLPAEEREGTLWVLFRELQGLGLQVDSRGYTGCFRVKCQDPASIAKISEVIANTAHLDELGVAHAMNLGMYDFFPKAAGKGNTVRYLQRKWGVTAEDCAALFDDDNDIPMARECARGYLPGITSESVRKKVEEERGWTLAPSAGTGVFATEEILSILLASLP